jgi:hypothetical protein
MIDALNRRFPVAKVTLLCTAAVLSFPLAGTLAQVAPPNDDFPGTTVSGTTVSVVGNNTGATVQAGEPLMAVASPSSVWWSWTAPQSGGCSIDTFGSLFNTTLGVYTGSDVSALMLVAQNDDAPGANPLSRVLFTASAGTTYRIQVSGNPSISGDHGSVQLNIAPYSPPNDNFPGSTAKWVSSAYPTGTNIGATPQGGEPNPAGVSGTHSVWWTWTPQVSQYAVIDTIGSDFDTTLGVYTGSTVSALTLLLESNDTHSSQSQVAFQAIAGTPYRLQVNGVAGACGMIWLNLHSLPGPLANDDFPGTLLTGPAATVTGDLSGASYEAGEPNPAGVSGMHSVWWTWTAPFTGKVVFDTSGSLFNTTLGVYTGSVVSGLSLVAENDDYGGAIISQVAFTAAAGATYRIQLNGAGGATGTYQLTLSSPPVNDDFPGSTLVGGTAAADNTFALPEAGEPNPAGVSGPRSVWWSWTAAATGPVVVDTFGSGFDTTLGIYTGSVVSALLPVGENNDAGSSSRSQLVFQAVSGTTYRIQVNGMGGSRGTITLNLADYSPPPNDDFPGTTLAGSTVTAAGDSTTATADPQEPSPMGSSGARSVWWSWTAPASGAVSIDTFGSSFNTTLGVYTGSSVGGLTLVAENDDTGSVQSEVAFKAQAGIVYRIQVNGPASALGGESGTIVLHIAPCTPPPNDDFPGISITGASVTVTGSNVFATAETGEPDPAGVSGMHSVWWSWTAPANGTVYLDTAGSSYETTLGIYTGGSAAGLSLVGESSSAGVNYPALAVFTATAGSIYRIQVNGVAGAQGTVQVNLYPPPPPPPPVNDSYSKCGSSGLDLLAPLLLPWLLKRRPRSRQRTASAFPAGIR